MLLTNPDNEDPALSSEKYSFAYHQVEILHLQLTKPKKEKKNVLSRLFLSYPKNVAKYPISCLVDMNFWKYPAFQSMVRVVWRSCNPIFGFKGLICFWESAVFLLGCSYNIYPDLEVHGLHFNEKEKKNVLPSQMLPFHKWLTCNFSL